jgi:hypothetical protein
MMGIGWRPAAESAGVIEEMSVAELVAESAGEMEEMSGVGIEARPAAGPWLALVGRVWPVLVKPVQMAPAARDRGRWAEVVGEPPSRFSTGR